MTDDPYDYSADDFDPDESLIEEQKMVQKQVKRLIAKIRGESSDPITHDDLLQYMRVINFNFAAMNKIVNNFQFNDGIIHQELGSITKKLSELDAKIDNFLEFNSLIEESLNEPDSSDEQ